MRHVLRRRRADGITELQPLHERLARPEWYLAAFTVLLVSTALYVSTAIPPSLLAAVLFALLCGELCLSVRDLLELRRPPAQVLVFTRWR